MSVQTICDGCGKPSETQERGMIKKLDYCADCVVRVDAFIAARDALHTGVMERWNAGLEEIRALYADLSLPDE